MENIKGVLVCKLPFKFWRTWLFLNSSLEIYVAKILLSAVRGIKSHKNITSIGFSWAFTFKQGTALYHSQDKFRSTITSRFKGSSRSSTSWYAVFMNWDLIGKYTLFCTVVYIFRQENIDVWLTLIYLLLSETSAICVKRKTKLHIKKNYSISLDI